MALLHFHPNEVVMSTPNPKRGDWIEAFLTPPVYRPFLTWPEPGEMDISPESINWRAHEREYDDGGGAAMAFARYGRCSTFVPETLNLNMSVPYEG